MTGWTDARVEILKDRWRQGWSAGNIAAELLISRNAVIGKIDRMRLTREAGPRAARKSRAATPGRTTPFRAPKPKPLPPPEPSAAPLNGISLFDLTNETCRWPKGLVGAADFCFCGRPDADLSTGKPYCAEHTKRAKREKGAA